jgi:two-component system sensor histidine kinase BaeS
MSDRWGSALPLFRPSAALLVGTAISFFFARAFLGQALRPVGEMTRRAEQIDAPHLDQRIAVPEKSGEFTELAQGLNKMLDRLQAAFEEQRSIVSNLSHEVKTPLGNIRLWLESMMTEGRAEEDLQKLARALEEVASTTQLVTNLLALSQLEAGNLEMKREAVDVGRLNEDILETTRLLCRQKGVELQASLPEGCVVRGDMQALRRAFSNILTNAVQHTGSGGRIVLSVSRDNG